MRNPIQVNFFQYTHPSRLVRSALVQFNREGAEMTTKTSGEIEKEFIDNLKASTKKDLNGWLAEISSLGITKRNDIINSLKNDYAFGHMNASLLAGIYLNGGKPVYGSTDDLLENQFAKAEAMRELYESVINFVKKNFPGVT